MAIIFLAAHIGTKSCNEINDVIAFLKSTKLTKLNKIYVLGFLLWHLFCHFRKESSGRVVHSTEKKNLIE